MRPLAFLLVLPLLAACPGDDGTSEETGASATETGTTGSGSTDTGQPGSSTGPEPTTGSNETEQPTPPDDSSGGGSATMEACTAACMHLIECSVVDLPNCGIPCVGIEDDVAGCESEYVAQQECVTALSCEDAQVWADAMGAGGTACDAEDSAFYACAGGDSG